MKIVIIIVTIYLGCFIPCIGQSLDFQTIPEVIYKNNDGTKWDTESFFFKVVLTGSLKQSEITGAEMTIQMFNRDSLMKTEVYPQDLITKIKEQSFTISDESPVYSTRRRFQINEIFDFPVEIWHLPSILNIDKIKVHLVVSKTNKKKITIDKEFPIHSYEQKTTLVFPFKGLGIITQGQLNNGGHAGHSINFAIDAMALTEMYSPMVSMADSNSAFATWGKEIIAPAGGTVIYARNDVPDNLPGQDPEEIFKSIHDPIDAMAGNAIIIDHGNGEHSVLMHMQQNSVRVKKGDKVESGQVIGLIGNSGNSFQPHLHFHLQSGPTLFKDVSLPFTFGNVSGGLVQGKFFETK